MNAIAMTDAAMASLERAAQAKTPEIAERQMAQADRQFEIAVAVIEQLESGARLN